MATFTTSATLSEPLAARARRLGKLLAASQLPSATVEGITAVVPNLNLRQVDLLIGALSREQQEWDKVEEVLFAAQRDVEDRLQTTAAAQHARVAELVERVADAAEHEEVERIRGELANGA
ncbi:MAG: hypothetical protein U0514_02065 [Candidatus Andersenbacteria bacterium]